MCMWNIVFIFQTIWKIMFWMWHELGKKQHWLLPFGASKNNTYVQYWLKNQLMWILGCIPLGCSGSGSVIWDLHSDHGTSKWTNESFPRLDSSSGNYCRTSDIVRPKCCKCPTNFAMRDERWKKISSQQSKRWLPMFEAGCEP